MIDLKSHIVPGVDDGPASEKEALKMIKMAQSDGINSIVLTPHVFSPNNLCEEIEMVFESTSFFMKRVRELGFDINLLRGAQVLYNPNLRNHLKNFREFLTINNSTYFLLELPAEFILPSVRENIYNFLSYDFIPILAHPEKNPTIQRNPEILYNLIRSGALSQINAGSFRGDFGKSAREFAFGFLKHNLVHVIASDSHSHNDRPPELSFLYSLLKKQKRAKIDLLIKEIPGAILEDRGIPDIGMPELPGEKKSIFDLLKKKIVH